MHSSLIGKVEKANRYARELDRITIDRLALTFRGDNDTHHVSLDAGQWHCTCHYFDSWQTCVHVLTLQKIMGVMLPDEAQESIFSGAGCRSRLTPSRRRPAHRTRRASIDGSAPSSCPLQGLAGSQPPEIANAAGVSSGVIAQTPNVHEPLARIARKTRPCRRTGRGSRGRRPRSSRPADQLDRRPGVDPVEEAAAGGDVERLATDRRPRRRRTGRARGLRARSARPGRAAGGRRWRGERRDGPAAAESRAARRGDRPSGRGRPGSGRLRARPIVRGPSPHRTGGWGRSGGPGRRRRTRHRGERPRRPPAAPARSAPGPRRRGRGSCRAAARSPSFRRRASPRPRARRRARRWAGGAWRRRRPRLAGRRRSVSRPGPWWARSVSVSASAPRVEHPAADRDEGPPRTRARHRPRRRHVGQPIVVQRIVQVIAFDEFTRVLAGAREPRRPVAERARPARGDRPLTSCAAGVDAVAVATPVRPGRRPTGLRSIRTTRPASGQFRMSS